MSETAGAENVIPPAEASENGGVADNPAWSDFLGKFPEAMHDMVRPALQDWDAGVNQRILKVHETYAGYKPYMDAGISPEILGQAYGIYQAIETDPRKVFDLLGETYGYSATPQNQQTSQGPQNPQQQNNSQQAGNDEYDLSGGQFNPELARYQQMTDTMARMLIEQENQKKQAAEDAQLDSFLKSAHEKHGDFDEKFVLGYMNSGFKMEEAIAAYQAMTNTILSNANRPQAPITLGGPGSTGVPSNQINVTGMSRNDARTLAANMMRAANQQG